VSEALAKKSPNAESDWPRSPVGQICDVIRGVTYKKAQSSETPAKNRLPVLRATNIQDAHLVLDQNLVYVPSELVSDKQRLVPGDIVIATSSGSKHLVGKTAQVREPWEGSFGAFCAAIRPKIDINPRYLGYFFESPEYKKYIAARAMGVNINNLRRGDLEEISVPIAPRDQQDRIVAEIEKQFSRLDEAVASLKRVKANLKRYKAAVLKAAVEGKLTEEWRKQNPDVEPASKLLERILTERRTKWEEAELAKMKAKGKEPKNNKWKDKYPVPAAPAESGAHDMPSTWELVSLEAVTSAARVICYGILMPKAHIEDGVLYVKVRDMKGDKVSISSLNRTSTEIAAKYQRASLKYGDLLLSIRGTYGRVADVPRELEGGNITQDTVRIDFSRHCDRAFMAVFLRSPRSQQYFKRVARGVAVKGVNVADVRATPTLFPPPDEQVAIASIAEQAVTRLSVLEADVDVAVLHANRLRQSVLAAAFRGSY
jgi:type I restriction enzyme S subunit